MKNILVAINFEKNAKILVSKAEELALALNAKVWVLHVSEPDPDDFLSLEAGPQFAQDKRVENRKKDAALVKELTTLLQEKNIEAEGLLLEGPTAKTIRKEVQELNIDLVIAGHHKKNIFYQMFVSKIEQDLLDKSRVPVLLVPLK